MELYRLWLAVHDGALDVADLNAAVTATMAASKNPAYDTSLT